MSPLATYGYTPKPADIDPDATPQFSPIIARTETWHQPVCPSAYDCVRLVVPRSGSAILLSEFGEKPVKPGDVVLLGSNVLCGSDPEGHFTTTTVYLDTDYLVDQIFWQYAGVLQDRLDAQGFAETVYSEPAQILRVGEQRTGMMMPWLDELVALTIAGDYTSTFHRMQALWFSIVDVVAPYIRISPVRRTPTQRATTRPTLPRDRRFAPLRAEAAQVRDAMRADIAESWTLPRLAAMVHLSPKHLCRIFTETFGKTPLAYLTMLRVEEMARLLRETDLTVAEAGRQVGWRSRSRASDAFVQCIGVTPRRYRAMRSTYPRHQDQPTS
ncbi:helix-turn-helix domain-containing protein [Nonomuraea fastidiosa]|uniref:AraC family transcriptional regulator n=1 Tax=Nonomuraea TaxID=83681 RepID=UPI003248EF94